MAEDYIIVKVKSCFQISVYGDASIVVVNYSVMLLNLKRQVKKRQID